MTIGQLDADPLAMGSELTPMIGQIVDVSNDQRHDAALTIAEHSDDMPETAAYFLTLVGLAREDVDGAFRCEGTDEFEMSWFTPRVKEAS